MKTAEIARAQVNHPDFRGNITMKGMILSKNNLLSAIRASSRVHKWTEEDQEEVINSISELHGEIREGRSKGEVGEMSKEWRETEMLCREC